MSNRGNLIVISGPSGSGKTSLASRALKEVDQLKFSVSHTTRKPRPGEQNSVEYFFISEEEFQEMVRQDAFLEHARVYGNYYGTSRANVETLCAAGYDVLLDIDVQGTRQVKAAYPEAILIFVFPPSLEVLTERLKNRGSDHPSNISERLSIAEGEIKSYKSYEYVIINEDIEESLRELKPIIQGARFRLKNREERVKEIVKTFPRS
ncbi:guanylate kinase [Acidobacteria bacterium AH-259-D05]|nr:guanylate kinase [Acidobacteria bacterium AH-259-D05]